VEPLRTRWRRAVTGLIRLGAYYATRPTYSTTVVVTGTTYYYAGGVYYAHSGSGYVVVSAPPGAVVHAVPVSTTVVYVGATPYYYQNGTYYVATTQPAPPPPTETTVNVNVTVEGSGSGGEGEEPAEPEMTAGEDHNFEVVAPPAGATVPYVPEEADEETIAGKKYFVYDGAYYRPFVSDGETIYMVVEDPREAAAALLTLPAAPAAATRRWPRRARTSRSCWPPRSATPTIGDHRRNRCPDSPNARPSA